LLRSCFNTIILFVVAACLPLGASATKAFIFASSDTLIIDSDTIYIEQEQVLLPEDSLPTAAQTLKQIRRNPLSASLSVGTNVTQPFVQSMSGAFTTLNQFVGMAHKPQVNLVAGGDVGVQFLTLKGKLGDIELSAVAGYAFNKIKIRYSTIEDPLQLKADSVLFFDAQDSELLMGFFTLTEPPFVGEVDTLYIPLQSSLLSYRSHDVSAKLRATLNRGNRRARYFLETGIVSRFVEMQSTEDSFYFLNENGSYTSTLANQIKSNNLLVPHFAVGVEKSILVGGATQDRFFTLGAVVNFSVPAAMIYEDELMTIESKNYGVHFFARYFF
jgi:hypothetical protein